MVVELMSQSSFSGWFAMAGAAFALVVALAFYPWSAEADSQRVLPSSASEVTLSYSSVVKRVSPAVVNVYSKRVVQEQPMAPFFNDPFFQRFFGGQDGQGGRRPSMEAPIEHGVGSGVIVSEDGNILTNNHVVGGADHVTVALSDGREFTAKVLGTDEPTDLAVVHIDAKDLPTLPLGDSDRVRVGDVVLAIGNPLDVGQTVTMGIISAKGRTTDMSGGSYEDFLQTDAPVNPGNSGGPLFNMKGEVIGINSQIYTQTGGYQGVSFAVPIYIAVHVKEQLLATGKVTRGSIPFSKA